MGCEMRILRFYFLIFLCLTFFATIAPAEETDEIKDELFKKGVYLFRQENFDEALKIFKEVTIKEPESSLAEYYLGLTYKRIEDYVSARKHLEASLNLEPKIAGALIELVDLLYRIGDFDSAKKWIEVAENEGVRPAQAKFLKGLTLQKSGEYEASVKAFEEAKDLDDRLKQSADYQIGVCYLKMKKYTDARSVFKEVFAVDPYSEIAGYATRYIEALDRKSETEKPFHIVAKTAFEYDSNVILKPTDTSLVTGVEDQADTREIYDLKGDYTFRTEDKFLSLKAGYGLRYSKQNDLGKYDVLGNNFSLQPAASFEKVTATFPVNYSHTIVDEKNYLSSVSAGNINNITVGKTDMAQIGVLYTYDDYLRLSIVPGESRTGNEIAALLGWFHFFPENKAFVNAGYTLNKDWTKGDNWEYLGNKASLGLSYPFWEKFKFNLGGEIFFQNFDNTHTIYDKKRADQVYTVSPLVSYEFFKNMEFQVRYTYVNDRSNLRIYEYDRHIVSTGVQYKF